MKTDWNYSELAVSYVKRPDYAAAAVEEMLFHAGVGAGARVCDVGAGVAHLTLKLAARPLKIHAVEPNEEMRKIGRDRTAVFTQVIWSEGTGEKTGQPSDWFDMVTFGSSFNVTDRALALKETYRILAPGGWFACLWNHRDLEDPLQRRIEAAIKARLAGYDYGSRREDQTPVIEASGLFSEVRRLEGSVNHAQSVEDCLQAWRSHATLRRQAGPHFEAVMSDIEKILLDTGKKEVRVPYVTRVWMARTRKEKR